MIRIYLNSVADTNTPINAPSLWLEATANCQGIEDLELTYSRKDSVVQRAITNSLKFFNGAYDLLFDKLVTNQSNYVWVKIEIDGFNYTFPYLQIKWNAIEWCTDRCELSANLTTWNADLDAYRNLKNTLIWDEEFLNNLTYNNPFTGQVEQAHPLVRMPLRKTVAFSFAGSTNWKFGVVGIYLRHYYYNLCHKIGLSPSSSIFNYTGLNAWTGDDYDDDNYFTSTNSGLSGNQPKRNPYHNSVVLLNKNLNPEDDSDLDAYRVSQSRPRPKALTNALNYNGVEFLEKIGQLFNARYRLKNGLLEFERKDYFYLSNSEWVNLDSESICLNLKRQNNWSYLRLEYQGDSTLYKNSNIEYNNLNPCGIVDQNFNIKEMISFPEKLYQDIVEWNSPPSVRQEGELNKILPFDNFRSNNNVLDNLNDKYGFLSSSLEIQNPMILALREDTPINRKNPYLQNLPINYPYNYVINKPFFAKKTSKWNVNGQICEINWEGTLYDNFHFIDDPRRRPNARGYEGKEPYKTFEYTMTTDFDCDMLNTFDIDNYITTKVGQASMEEVVFKFKNLEVEIKGFV